MITVLVNFPIHSNKEASNNVLDMIGHLIEITFIKNGYLEIFDGVEQPKDLKRF